MTTPVLYRKRIIPDECILLKDDVLLFRNSDYLVTKWNALHVKKDLHHGYSCYLLNEGIKVSKFLREDGSLLYWYCDIVSHTYDPENDTYVFTDLLADVIVYPDDSYKVVDLDEVGIALTKGMITTEQVNELLNILDNLLQIIYSGRFDELKEHIEDLI